MHDIDFRRARRLAFAAAALMFASAGGCGAQNTPGPAPKPKPEQCRNLPELAPALNAALSGGSAERLRTLIERNKLLDPQADGTPSALMTLVHVSLRTLASMGDDPPEAGAPEGSNCNDAHPPPSRDSNRTCEARRIIRTFVREGKGLDALGQLDPIIAGVLSYIAGRPPATEPHYEVAGVLAATCSKAYCTTEDTLDVVGGLLSFLEPTLTDPKRPLTLISKLNAVLQDPAIRMVLDVADQRMGEAEMIAFGNLLLDNFMALPTEPDKFAAAYHRDLEVKINDLLTTTLKIGRDDPKYRNLRLALDELLGAHEKIDEAQPHGPSRPLLFDLLDPARPAAVLAPMQRLLNCVRVNDKDSATLKMAYALFYKLRVIDLARIMASVEGLARIDERVSLLTFGKRTVEMIRADQEGIAAARKLCTVAFDTRPAADGGKPNAQLIVPVAADLFEGGAVNEMLCVVDTLLFGCGGGEQPACPAPATP